MLASLLAAYGAVLLVRAHCERSHRRQRRRGEAVRAAATALAAAFLPSRFRSAFVSADNVSAFQTSGLIPFAWLGRQRLRDLNGASQASYQLGEDASYVAFVDTDIRLNLQRSVHAVELVTSARGALSGLRVLLLRPLLGRRGRIVAGANVEAEGADFRIVATSATIPDEAGPATVEVHIGGKLSAAAKLQSLLPPNTLVRLSLRVPLFGEAGDCLGWAHSVGAEAGSVAVVDRSIAHGAEVLEGAPQLLRAQIRHGDEGSLRIGSLLHFAPTLVGDSASGSVVPAAAVGSTVLPAELMELSRPRRLRAFGQMLRQMGNLPGLTSSAYKRDLLRAFRAMRFGGVAALEVGSFAGGTTAILSALFVLVFAVELSSQLLAQQVWTRGLNNVVKLCIDSGRPHAFAAIATNVVHVAVIDGDHDREHVFRDTFLVLHDVTCCVETIVYHDFCFREVFETVQLFVDAGFLMFKQSMGTADGWQEGWCEPRRPEGALFAVSQFRASSGASSARRLRLERLRQQFLGAGSAGDTRRLLEGSEWLLQTDYPLALLTLRFAPSLTGLRFIRAVGDDAAEFSPWRAALVGWRPGAVDPEVAEEALVVELRSASDAAEDGGEPYGLLVFEPELQGFTLTLLEAAAAASPRIARGLPRTVVGVRHAASNLLASEVHARSTREAL
eukprot:TRINITY_DN29262_c0_g2_i1.p1 TRINITY_DN29262_c0_g2~~TRINITY_DN29262_c0_g2_i1.p1  ORF type:complete len:672 (-),score=128.50 TRINITY_DN29262_c0_g2_i1:93-2108(-)